MQKLWYLIIWLKRIRHCRGFGIQSPSDYWLVRYVINEHWPYYQYDQLGQNDGWLRRKLGRLYFRLSNWLQPDTIASDDYKDYLSAGCHNATFGETGKLFMFALKGDYQSKMDYIYNKVTNDTVLVVDGIQHDKAFWQNLIADQRARITFDLYYCGIVLFDEKRHKKNYIINF